MKQQDPLSLEGQVLDGTYRIDSLVGEGGFGVVYRAFHLGFEEPVAVKCLKIPGSLSPTMREAFLRKFREEGKLLFQLSKGTLGIVQSIAVGDTTTPTGIWCPYFVLEWLEGQSLSEELKQRRAQGFRGRPITEVMRWLHRPAQALSYAHEKRVAHRDIKPGNLFVLRSNAPIPPIKILDFGIAKAMEAGQGDARKETAFSSFTPQYAAPEQFDSRLGPTGPWTDVYSFALVAMEMMMDQVPIRGETAISLMHLALDSENRPTPRARGIDVSEAVERVFLRALSVDPSMRFADAGGFWDALHSATSESRADGFRSVPLIDSAMVGTAPPHSALPTPLSISVHTNAPMNFPTGPIGAPYPVLTTTPQPPTRRVWAWVLFGIILGIAMIFVFGMLTCTTCVCGAL